MNKESYEYMSRQLEIFAYKLQEDSGILWESEPTSPLLDKLDEMSAQLQSLAFGMRKVVEDKE